MRNYLDIVLKSTGKQRPSQIILYFFDINNLIFLKKAIEKHIFRDYSKNIDINEYTVFEIMLQIYNDELLHNEVIDLEKTIKKMNRKTIYTGLQNSKSSVLLEKYRNDISNVHVCDLPVCTKK